MRKIIILIISTLLFSSEINDLLSTLNKLNNKALNEKINIDKVPSNLTVLDRNFILKSHAKTLYDLLKFIPGVQIILSSYGRKDLIIRGIRTKDRDKVKFLINGIDVTNTFFHNQFYFYNISAKLIKRLEFRKTPDAINYGDDAFLGVINIVLVDKLNKNFINLYKTNKNANSLSLHKNFKKLDILLNLYYSNPNVNSPSINLYDMKNKKITTFRKSQKVDMKEKNLFTSFRYEIDENNQFEYMLNYFKKGNYFGIYNVVPLKKDTYTKTFNNYLFYKNTNQINYKTTNNFTLGVKQFIFDSRFRLLPYNFLNGDSKNPNDDVIAGMHLIEYTTFLKNILHINTNKNNLKLIFTTKYSKPTNFYYIQYVPSLKDNKNEYNLGPNGEHLKGDNILKTNIKRILIAGGFDNIFYLNDSTAFNFGGRIDKYNNFKPLISYKTGAVKNYKSSTLKLIYSTAFRIPSFMELYFKVPSYITGNENLKPEKIAILELIFIKHFSEYDKLKFVAYKGKINDFIGLKKVNNYSKYDNIGSTDIKGIEANYILNYKKINYYISISKNFNKNHFSYLYGNVDIYKNLSGRKTTLKTFLNYKINNHYNFYISYFFGSKKRIVSTKIPSYKTTNIALTYKNNNKTFTFGVDNVFNHKNYTFLPPSPLIYNQYTFVLGNSLIKVNSRKIYFNINIGF